MKANIELNEEQIKEFYEMYHSLEEPSQIMHIIYDKIVKNLIDRYIPKKIVDLKSDCFLVFEKINNEFVVQKLDLPLGKYVLALETLDRRLCDMSRIVFKLNGTLGVNKVKEMTVDNVVGIHIVFEENINTYKLFLNKVKNNLLSDFNSNLSFMANGNACIEYYKSDNNNIGINIEIKPIDKS